MKTVEMWLLNGCEIWVGENLDSISQHYRTYFGREPQEGSIQIPEADWPTTEIVDEDTGDRATVSDVLEGMRDVGLRLPALVGYTLG